VHRITNAKSDRYSYSYCYRDTNSDSYAYAYAYTDADVDTYTEACSNTEASAHAAASTVVRLIAAPNIILTPKAFGSQLSKAFASTIQ
jgi:hypothetical protein